jgi:predicted PurR-regulated permease PerM
VLVGGAVWYARAPTVPLIVAALISTQVVPLVGWATCRSIPRGLAVAAGFIGAVLIVAGLAWVFPDALFGSLARRR